MGWIGSVINIFVALLLVAINGFFVAAEFSLVKVRISRVESLVDAKRLFAKNALWLAKRLEKSLSACQLGITMASLALGWVGEPAFAALLTPLLEAIGISSEAIVHTIAFIISFSFITSLHLVVGEQAPKIFAIRKPETMLLWCALPMQFFYLTAYPFMVALNASTDFLLGLVGMKSASEHEIPHSEEEIRALLSEAHVHGNLTRNEHSLLDAVFDFDDLICRRIMLPRTDVDFIDINAENKSLMEMIRRTKHTRYPVCDGSMDDILGVLHVKDLTGFVVEEDFDWRNVMRPPKKVSEQMPVSKLLLHFQGTHQLMAFVIDEYGNVIGIVTLENVLEEIIGDVADEFDSEDPEIVPDGPDAFVVLGTTAVDDLEAKLDIDFGVDDVDTVSGLLVHQTERLLTAGEIVRFERVEAKVMEVADDRAVKVRFLIKRRDGKATGD